METGRCFLVIADLKPYNFQYYVDSCAMRGGEPASIHSEQEIFLIAQITHVNFKILGAVYINGAWQWHDGSAWDYSTPNAILSNIENSYLWTLQNGDWISVKSLAKKNLLLC